MEIRLPKILPYLRYCILLLFCIDLIGVAVADSNLQKSETIKITGKVIDINGDPLSSVSIRVKGSAAAAVTDDKGVYTINATKGSILSFRLLGYDLKEVEVGNQNTINVTLLTSTQSLDEVVVVGYGTQRKSDITGAVTSISKERIEDMVRTDVVQLLQGAAAGLNIATTSAGSNPESGAIMLIRGRNSISASNEPLIVLDGVPYNGSMSDINPYDIESMEILKDASATAIYGSRASNGVIIIETKKGVKGKASIRYDGFYSIQSVANFPHLMTGEEYYRFKQGVVEDDDDVESKLTPAELAIYESGSYHSFTWKDLILRKGNSQQHTLSVSGGSDKTSYNASMSYLGTKGIVIGDQYKRGNSRINVTSNITKWLKIGSSNMLGYIDNSGATPSFIDLFNKSPLAAPFNPDGSINIVPIADDPRKINPIEPLLYDDLNKKYSLSSTNYLDIKIPSVEGLSYRLNTGLQYQSDEKNWYRGTNTGKSGALKGESEINTSARYSVLVENIVSYQKEIKKHNIFLTGLYSYEEKENKSNILNGEGFANDFLSYYGTTQASKVVPDFKYSKTSLISQMFRANYAYDSRYLLTATVRRDGYSGFGANKKYGVFPSVALGWNVANENFFNNLRQIVDVFKLRLSYGENGNQAINPYQTLSQLAGGDYIDGSTPAPGYIPSTLGTASLGWEATKSLNIGFDYGLLNSRITGEFNIYRNTTSDLLLKRAISPVHGVNSVFQNIGKTENEGLEFMVNSNTIRNKEFTWNTNFNFAFIRTKILDLYGNGLDDIANSWFLGEPIRVNYDYKFIGIWQEEDEELAKQYGAKPGYARYDDLNDNGVYDPEDRQIIGSQEPNFTWGMTNNFTYKDFALSVFMYGKRGTIKANPYKDRNYLITREYWTPENPSNTYWSNVSQATRYLGKGITPSVYENADFIRVKDITLTYSLPKKVLSRVQLSRVKVFFTSKNPFTITKWDALDPELDNQRAVPLQREFIFGLNLGL